MDLQFKESLKNSYNENAKLRNRLSIEPWKLKEIEHFITFVDKGEQTRILDLGAGTGQHSLHMKEMGLDVTCIDLSSKMIEICLQKGLKAYEMDFYNLTFEDNSFDSLWAMNTLLHVPNKELIEVLKEIRRVMKPGGTFYMGVYGGYNSEGIWEEDSCLPKRFFSFYDEETMKEKVSQVFELQEFRTIPLEGIKLNYQALLLRKV